MQVTNPKRKRFVKGLIFAPGGHGKTHLLGTAQEDERTFPMLFIDFEGGEETLDGLDIDVVAIRSWSDYDEVYDALVSGEHWKLEGSTLREGQQYKSLGIDSISETHVWALLTILDKQAARREDSDTRDPDMLEQGDYGKASTQMRRLLRDFRDLPMHVFYTSASKEVRERKVGMVKVPALAGQMADEVVHMMSVVAYLARLESEDGGPDDRILLLNAPGFRTKVRTPWGATAPDEIENPTITSLLDILGVKVGVGEDTATPTRASGSALRKRPTPAPQESNGDGGGEGHDDPDKLTRIELRERLTNLGVTFTPRMKTAELRQMYQDAINNTQAVPDTALAQEKE